MRDTIACLILVCIAAGPARAQASFDCARAASLVERAICATPDLAALDGQLNRAYAAARDRLREQDRRILLDRQRAWLRSRDAACLVGARVDTTCLGDLYRRRLAELAGPAPGRGESAGLDWSGRWRFARPGFDGAMRLTPLTAGLWRLSIQTAMTGGNFSTCELAAELRETGGSLVGEVRDAGSGIRVEWRGDGLLVTQDADSGMCGLNATFEGLYRRAGQ